MPDHRQVEVHEGARPDLPQVEVHKGAKPERQEVEDHARARRGGSPESSSSAHQCQRRQHTKSASKDQQRKPFRKASSGVAPVQAVTSPPLRMESGSGSAAAKRDFNPMHMVCTCCMEYNSQYVYIYIYTCMHPHVGMVKAALKTQ